MSRSRKKTPCFHVSSRDRRFKKWYNRKLRKLGLDAIPDGNAYRKMNESWYVDEGRNVGRTYREYRDTSDDGAEESICWNKHAKWFLRK